MEVIIEFGTPEIEEIIKQELVIFLNSLGNFNPPLKLDRIIISPEIEKKVNEFYGNDTFKSVRNHGDNSINVAAKYCTNEKEGILFLSSILYLDNQDSVTRYFVFFHELFHANNKQKLQLPSQQNFSIDNSFFTLYWIYDEYVADRNAYKIVDVIFPKKTELWDAYLISDLNGFSSMLVDEKNYQFIKNEISKFRNHQLTVNEYCENIRQLASDLSVAIVHAYSLIHHYPNQFSPTEFSKSKYVNVKTLNLIEYISKKYKDAVFDLSDGLDLINQYLTNFGVLFEERDTGPYCHILDI